MKLDHQYEDCERVVLKEYQALKNDSTNEQVVCHHVGEFSQEILISLISLIDNSLLKNSMSTGFKKRLKYIVIETIQNIISHSDKIDNESLLAYIVLTENSDSYTLTATNTILNENTPQFISCIKELLKADKNELNTIIEQRLQLAELDENGRAGIGLLSILYKTDKNFDYKFTQIGDKISILNLSLTLHKKEMV